MKIKLSLAIFAICTYSQFAVSSNSFTCRSENLNASGESQVLELVVQPTSNNSARGILSQFCLNCLQRPQEILFTSIYMSGNNLVYKNYFQK